MAVVCFLVLAWGSQSATGQEFSRAVVPVVSNVVGVNGVHWRCRVEIRNDFNYPMELLITLPIVEGTFFQQTLDPGQILRFNDIVNELFGLREVISPLLVQSSGPRSPTVIVSTYGIYRGASTVPQYTPTVYGHGQRAVGLLRGLTSNKAYRTNIGMVNLSETSASFTAALQLVPGRNVAVAQLTLPPNAAVQMQAGNLFPLMDEGENFSVLIDSSALDTYTYAAVISNRTHDSRYVAPGPPLIAVP